MSKQRQIELRLLGMTIISMLVLILGIFIHLSSEKTPEKWQETQVNSLYLR